MTDRATTRTVFDPFLGRKVEVGDDILDRLRGRYACGPVMPDGQPEMGWRQHPQVPIQMDAADRIERLEGALAAIAALLAKAAPVPDGSEGGKEIVLTMPDAGTAADLRRALEAVREGRGATLGPEPAPRGPLLGWGDEGDAA